mgnify:CR=1 FL=1
MQNKVEEAKKILLGNRKNGYTLPTNNKLYPAQWNWDSAFIALGYSYFNLDFSIIENKFLFIMFVNFFFRSLFFNLLIRIFSTSTRLSLKSR